MPSKKLLNNIPLLDQFINNNEVQKLFSENDKVLLTVSGGIDSVAMLHLFNWAGIEFGVAHCNFQLRGKEADGDQKFVKDLTESINKKFYTINFDTIEYAARHKISIQMAARDLRYNWFSEIALTHNYSKIATAHNLDDVVETQLLNLARGTGINGLTGIAAIKENIIRPLLFASRKQIEEFIKSGNYKYREDSSNSEVKYKRNLVRHEIIPLFKKLNPSFTNTIIHETKIFQSVSNLYHEKLEEIKDKIIHVQNNRTLINIKSLKKNRVDCTVLYDLLEQYGFSWSDICEVYMSIESQPGKKFISQTHILVRDRDHFIVEPLCEKQEVEYYIDSRTDSIEVPIGLKFKIFKKPSDYNFPKNQQNIAVDSDKVKFPLILRHWKTGDSFYPLGVKGRKKLSDYFTDRKIPITEKNKIWILTSDNQIIWVIGYQINELVKITESTQNILLIERIG